eukprot:9121-Chlamydomonas_euryale.AAC.1
MAQEQSLLARIAELELELEARQAKQAEREGAEEVLRLLRERDAELQELRDTLGGAKEERTKLEAEVDGAQAELK